MANAGKLIYLGNVTHLFLLYCLHIERILGESNYRMLNILGHVLEFFWTMLAKVLEKFEIRSGQV